MSIVFSLIIIIVLILLNGVFVAAEFALIGVRPSRIEQLAAEGNRTADWVKHVVQDRRQTDRYIATSQLGITLASLGLGMYGEPVIAHVLEGPMHDWFGLEGPIVHTLSFLIALTIITYLHVVIGEMVPKSLALQSADRTVLMLAGPMRLVERLFAIPVRVLNWIGLHTLKLAGIPTPGEASRLYSPNELEMIVSESYAQGLVEEYEQSLVGNIMDFAERRVVQIMVPRTQLEAIPVDATRDKVLEFVFAHPHSRFPVYMGTIDNVIGVVHLKDIVRQELAGEPFDLRAMLRQAIYVPETLMVEALLDTFRETRHHMAIVLDEHGGTLGAVTLEDLLEEVVGEVRDEFDAAEEPDIVLVEPGRIEAKGSALLDDFEAYLPLDDHGYDVQTIGGLALAEHGRPPEVGTEIALNDDVTLRVDEMDELSIKRVSLHYPAE